MMMIRIRTARSPPSRIYTNGEVNGFLKVAWDMSMTQYIMKNNKDGSVAQAWTKM